jgi:lipoprotein-anchoring transpeptidase ErfK/SrfK
MHGQTKTALLSALLPAVLLAAGFSAQAQTKAKTQTHKQPHAKHARRRLVVSLPDRRMALLEDGHVKKIYVVAVGSQSTPSPTGTFTIMSRVTNPSYSHAGKVVAPGPDNPVGTRWMGLSAKGYGIHGTNAPTSIGKAASHGCIRMRKSDLEELFADVNTGDEVEIRGERDAEAAEIFGDANSPAAAALVQLAAADEADPATTKNVQAAVAVPAGE